MTVQLPPFQVFFDAHRDDVYRFVLAMVGPNSADDVFQETFMSALRAYPTLTDATSLRAWIFTIARRKAIDEHRGGGRRAIPTGVVPELASALTESAPEPGLWNDVRALPPKQRAAVVHRYVHDRNLTGNVVQSHKGLVRALHASVVRRRNAASKPA